MTISNHTNIALLSQVPLHGQGGVEILTRELVRGLSATHRICLASPDTSDELASLGLADHIASHLPISQSSPIHGETTRILTWLREEQVQLAHFHLTGTFAWGAGKWNGGMVTKVASSNIRCITTNHQAFSPLDHSRRNQSLLRSLASHARKIPGKTRQLRSVFREILVSRHDLELSKRWFPHTASRFGMIYHSQLDGDSLPSALPNSREILNLASIAFRKGQHILAEAFARVAADFPEWHLIFVGMPLQKECLVSIQDTISKYDLKDRILLPGPSSSPRQVLAGSEIYVQPSLLEGLGLSLQEAQFEQRPCIGTRVGGIPELITDGHSGLLVPPNDITALANALKRLMSDRKLREQFGQNAHQEIIRKGMTRDGMIAAHHRLYSECLSQNS